MSHYHDQHILPNQHYNDGPTLVFKKLANRLDCHLSEQKLHEERYSEQLKKSEHDNEKLENELMVKKCDITKLTKQLRLKEDQYSEMKQERDLLQMHLQAEIHNSNRLNRDVEDLLQTKKHLLEQIDRIKTEHITELRNIVEKFNKHH